MSAVGAINITTTVTILSGQTASGEVNLVQNTDREMMAITIFAPATLPETVNVQAAPSIGGTYRILQSDGVDIAIPVNKATTITHLVAGGFRLLSTGAVAADRTFDVCIRFTQRWLS